MHSFRVPLNYLHTSNLDVALHSVDRVNQHTSKSCRRERVTRLFHFACTHTTAQTPPSPNPPNERQKEKFLPRHSALPSSYSAAAVEMSGCHVLGPRTESPSPPPPGGLRPARYPKRVPPLQFTWWRVDRDRERESGASQPLSDASRSCRLHHLLLLLLLRLRRAAFYGRVAGMCICYYLRSRTRPRFHYLVFQSARFIACRWFCKGARVYCSLT